MSTQLDRFNNIISEKLSSNRQAQIRYVTCQSVDWENKTMVADDAGVPYHDVSLGLGDMCIKPALGSICLIAICEGKEALTYMLAAEKIEQIKVSGQDENLKDILNDFVNEVKKIIVVQGTSPSVPALTEISKRIETLFK